VVELISSPPGSVCPSRHILLYGFVKIHSIEFKHYFLHTSFLNTSCFCFHLPFLLEFFSTYLLGYFGQISGFFPEQLFISPQLDYAKSTWSLPVPSL
jgi:hypothetical protein